MIRVLAAVTVSAFLLGACAAPSQIESAADSSALDRGAGIILVGIDGPPELAYSDWMVEARKINAATGAIETPNYGDAPARYVQARWHTGGLFSRTERYTAYQVVPGDYALTSVRPFQGAQNDGQTQDHYYLASPGQAAAGAIFLGAIAIAKAAGESMEEAEFGKLDRPAMEFARGGSVVAEAPRFKVGPGEVVYIGDFKLGADIYELDGPDPSVGGGGAAQPNAEVFAPFVQYSTDTIPAQAAVAKLGLSGRPMRTSDLGLPAQPTGLNPRMTPERIQWARKSSILETRRVQAPSAAEMPVGLNAPAPAATPMGKDQPPLTALPDAELRRRFLAGEISQEEYKKARAGQ